MPTTKGAFLQSDSAVEIFKMSDFGDLNISGLYVLEDKTYNINQNLITPNGFHIPDGVSPKFLGTDHKRNSITYTGTSDMFSGTNVGGFDVTELSLTANITTASIFSFKLNAPSFGEFFIRNQNASCPSGSVFDISNTVPSGNIININTNAFINCASLGTIDGFGGFSFFENTGTALGQGITLSNIGIGVWSLCNFFGNQNLVGTTFVDLQSGVSKFFMLNSNFQPESNENVMNIDLSLSSSMISVVVVNTDDGGAEFFKAGSLDETIFNFRSNEGITPNSSGFIFERRFQQTTDDTLTTVYTYTVPEGKSVNFEVNAQAQDSTASSSLGQRVFNEFRREVGGSAARVGSETGQGERIEDFIGSPRVKFNVSGNDALIQVEGRPLTIIDWDIKITISPFR